MESNWTTGPARYSISPWWEAGPRSPHPFLAARWFETAGTPPGFFRVVTNQIRPTPSGMFGLGLFVPEELGTDPAYSQPFNNFALTTSFPYGLDVEPQ